MTRIALAALAALTFLAAPVAADPFAVSERVCIENGWMNTTCVTNDGSTGPLKVGDIIEMINSDIDRFRAKNGWGEEVTPETVVPIGASFAFG